MTEPLKVDDLNVVAKTLARGAESFAGMSASPPTAPDAGVSSGVVAETLAALAKAMSTVTRSAANSADAVQNALKGYQGTDQKNSDALHRQQGNEGEVVVSLDIRVFGDPAACSACADELTRLGSGIESNAHSFDTAKQQSESLWHGKGGDNFRTTVTSMGSGTHDIATQATHAAQAVQAFTDNLNTVKARMKAAADVAVQHQLRVTADLIGDPDPIDPTSQNVGPQVRHAIQVAGYQAAKEAVEQARQIETAAHAVLQSALKTTTTVLRTDNGKYSWMLIGAGASYVGTAVAEADKWKSIADDDPQIQKYRTMAADYEAAGHLGPAEAASKMADAQDISKFASENAGLVKGATDNPLSQILARNVATEGESTLSKIGSKIPGVGAGIAGLQTGVDVYSDRHAGAGTIAKDVGKDAGGFIAGTAATDLILASCAGGPATVLAVGAGVGVAWGVGEVIDHWSDWF